MTRSIFSPARRTWTSCSSASTANRQIRRCHMMADITRLELRLRRRSTIGYAAGMALYTLVVVALYPSFKNSTSLNGLSGSTAAAVAGQDEDGTLALLTVLPLRRRAILFQKAGAMALQALFMAAAVTLCVF